MKPFFYYRLKEKVCNIGAIWDKLAPAIENAIDFAHKNINEEPKRYTEDGGFSLEYCIAASGETINERYRHNNMEEIDLKIADMISKHKTKIPIIVYRGVCEAVYEEMQVNAKKIKGADLYERSFLQTSLVKGHESNRRYHLRIYVPQGVEAIYLGNVNFEQYYYEVDLQCGAKLKIISIDNKYINCKLI